MMQPASSFAQIGQLSDESFLLEQLVEVSPQLSLPLLQQFAERCRKNGESVLEVLIAEKICRPEVGKLIDLRRKCYITLLTEDQIFVPMGADKLAKLSATHASPPNFPNGFVGTTIAGQRLRELLGVGPQAAVYLIDSPNPTLLRLFRPGLIDEQSSNWERCTATQRRWAGLPDNLAPAIVEHGRHGDCGYILSERIDGVSYQTLYGNTAVPLSEALSACAATARLLATAHAVGLGHGNLKPSNIFRRNDGRICLTDAAPCLRSLPFRSRLDGTAADALFRADIRGVGLLLFGLLTGEDCFDSPDRWADGEPLISTIDLNELDLPAPVALIMKRAHSASALLRFGTIAEMADALANIVKPPSPPSSGRKVLVDVPLRATPLPPANEPPAARPISSPLQPPAPPTDLIRTIASRMESPRSQTPIAPMIPTKDESSRAAGEPLPEIGSVLGRCLLTERIGQGTSGVVYRALHTSLNISVAVKVLQRGILDRDSVLSRQFRVEAQLLAQLNHPHIVRVWDFDDLAETPYLVLEFVEGLSLAELIEQCGRLRPDRAIQTILQIADALNAGHQLGIVHRDVKPANILIARDGTAKLADLGLAIVQSSSQASIGTSLSGRIGEGLAGTVAYMPPEQATNPNSVDHRSDIYALGSTLYHALTGQMPFPGKSRMEVILKHARVPLTPVHELAPDVPPIISEVVARMMAKTPEERFQDYTMLRLALCDLLTESGNIRLPSGSSIGSNGIDSTAASIDPSKTPHAPSGNSFWKTLKQRLRG